MKCPTCKKPSQDHYKPFCSKRCADIDLGRWFNESYVVEGAVEEELSNEANPLDEVEDLD